MIRVNDQYDLIAIWHFTDRSNLESIQRAGGLLSLAELSRRGIDVPSPGGNQWSHDADRMNGVDDYVHLAFVDDHPMQFIAVQEKRISSPVWLKINPDLVLSDGVRFTSDVANKSGVPLLTPDEGSEEIDFEVLLTRTDWRDPEIKVRRKAALKSEILVPRIVAWDQILEIRNG